MPRLANEELHTFAGMSRLVMLVGAIVFGVGVFFIPSPHETLGTCTVIAGIC